MRRFLLIALVSLAACGLAEDPRDEENKHTYLTIPDAAFRDYCLREFDTDGDGRLSRYEAQRVRSIVCPGLGIASLTGIEAFTRLERLDCSDNDLTLLDVQASTLLRRLDCANNALVRLDTGNLRSLTELDCSGNDLARVDLQTPSLSIFIGARNRLTTLDLRNCARTMERVDVRENPSLGLVYLRTGQVRQLQYDAPTEIIEEQAVGDF